MKLWTTQSCGAAALAALTVMQAAGAQAQPAPTMPPPPKTLGLMSATFASTDLDRSLAFYTKALGLTSPARIENPGAIEVPLLFPAGGASLLLIKANDAPPAAGPPRIGRVIVDVPDLKALAVRIEGAGYSLAQPLRDNPQHHVMVAVVKDPDGNELELVQRGH